MVIFRLDSGLGWNLLEFSVVVFSFFNSSIFLDFITNLILLWLVSCFFGFMDKSFERETDFILSFVFTTLFMEFFLVRDIPPPEVPETPLPDMVPEPIFIMESPRLMKWSFASTPGDFVLNTFDERPRFSICTGSTFFFSEPC